MSRDVSPEICGWCGAEEPCDCNNDVGGFDDMDGDDSDPNRTTENLLSRGTSACDGSCAPMCDWCLVGHVCPEDCGGVGGGCPHAAFAAGRFDDTDGDELNRVAETELVAELRADLTAAREAIRVLLGDAGLDGLGDLTTADGRSVVDIVRRGMGVGT